MIASKRGRKRLKRRLPRVDVIHDILRPRRSAPPMARRSSGSARRPPSNSIISPPRSGSFATSGPSTPARAAGRACKIAPVPLQCCFPRASRHRRCWRRSQPPSSSMALPLYRQETAVRPLRGLARPRHDGRLDDPPRRHACGAARSTCSNERLLAESLIHCDETRLAGPEERQGADCRSLDVGAGRGSARTDGSCSSTTTPRAAAPCRCDCCEGYRGILLTDGYEPYDEVALGPRADPRRLHGARAPLHSMRPAKAQPTTLPGHAKIALDFIGELYLIERSALGSGTSGQRRGSGYASAASSPRPIIDRRSIAWLEGLAPKVVPQSRLGKAVHYTLGQWPKLTVFLDARRGPSGQQPLRERDSPVCGRAQGLVVQRHRRPVPRPAPICTRWSRPARPTASSRMPICRCFSSDCRTCKTVDDFESMLPWNVERPLAAVH